MPRSNFIKKLLSGLLLALSYSCTGPGTLFEMTSEEPSPDQWKIAAFYSREAAKMREKAEELSRQAVTYEQLFGPGSEWVTGARLLAQYYEEQARELEHRSGKHAALAEASRRLRPQGSKSVSQ